MHMTCLRISVPPILPSNRRLHHSSPPCPFLSPSPSMLHDKQNPPTFFPTPPSHPLLFPAAGARTNVPSGCRPCSCCCCVATALSEEEEVAAAAMAVVGEVCEWVGEGMFGLGGFLGSRCSTPTHVHTGTDVTNRSTIVPTRTSPSFAHTPGAAPAAFARPFSIRPCGVVRSSSCDIRGSIGGSACLPLKAEPTARPKERGREGRQVGCRHVCTHHTYGSTP